MVDVVSNFKQGGKEFLRYGKRGEKVTVLKEMNEILICENKEGVTFPVKAEKVVIK